MYVNTRAHPETVKLSNYLKGRDLLDCQSKCSRNAILIELKISNVCINIHNAKNGSASMSVIDCYYRWRQGCGRITDLRQLVKFNLRWYLSVVAFVTFWNISNSHLTFGSLSPIGVCGVRVGVLCLGAGCLLCVSLWVQDVEDKNVS